jgi:hypothetical protein
MDIIALTQAVTTALIPVLPYLLKAGEKAAEETGKKVAGETWDWAKELWSKLRPKVEARPAALEAAQDVAESPDDADAQAALRLQLKKLVAEDETLARVLDRLLHESRTGDSYVNASGERSVAIGGDIVGSAIVTGDGNVVGNDVAIKFDLNQRRPKARQRN